MNSGIKGLMLETFREIEYKKERKMAGYKDISIIAVEGAVLIEANTTSFFDEMWVLALD